jgi:hypothetical protein
MSFLQQEEVGTLRRPTPQNPKLSPICTRILGYYPLLSFFLNQAYQILKKLLANYTTPAYFILNPIENIKSMLEGGIYYVVGPLVGFPEISLVWLWISMVGLWLAPLVVVVLSDSSSVLI